MCAAEVAPAKANLFEPVHDAHGPRLALVFGNHAPGGLCPYFAANLCHHCDIGAGEGEAFQPAKNLARIEWFREHYAQVLPRVAHLVVYNSGSVLNPREMPLEVLDAILRFARDLPALEIVSLDTREPFVTKAALEHLREVLGPRIEPRPILGLESADDAVRDGTLMKMMSRRGVERAFAAAREAGVGVDVNVVLGSPGTVDAAEDAALTARWVFPQGRVDLNLHPYYPSLRGLARFPAHPRCSLEDTRRAVRAVAAVRDELSPGSRLFIGWQDEGHDCEPGVRAEELLRAGASFDAFNRTQDPRVL